MTCFRFIPARAWTSEEVVDPALAEASRNTMRFPEVCPAIGLSMRKYGLARQVLRFATEALPVIAF